MGSKILRLIPAKKLMITALVGLVIAAFAYFSIPMRSVGGQDAPSEASAEGAAAYENEPVRYARIVFEY